MYRRPAFQICISSIRNGNFAATLKYSKVILDEVQSYDPHIIATIITGLKQITEMGGRFAIITATFPHV